MSRTVRGDAMRALDSQLDLISMFKSDFGQRTAIAFMPHCTTRTAGSSPVIGATSGTRRGKGTSRSGSTLTRRVPRTFRWS